MSTTGVEEDEVGGEGSGEAAFLPRDDRLDVEAAVGAAVALALRGGITERGRRWVSEGGWVLRMREDKRQGRSLPSRHSLRSTTTRSVLREPVLRAMTTQYPSLFREYTRLMSTAVDG